MKKLRASIAAKIVAAVLLAFSLAAAVGSAFSAVVLLVNTNIYSVKSWEESDLVENEICRDILDMLGCDSYSYSCGTLALPSSSDLFDRDGDAMKELAASGLSKDCPVSAAFYDESGAFLARNYELPDDSDAAELVCTLYTADLPDGSGLALSVLPGRSAADSGVSFGYTVSASDAGGVPTFEKWLADRYGGFYYDAENDFYYMGYVETAGYAPTSDSDTFGEENVPPELDDFAYVDGNSLRVEYAEYIHYLNGHGVWTVGFLPVKDCFTVICRIDSERVSAHPFNSELPLARLAFRLRGVFVAAAVIGAVLSLVLFAFLMSAAGWREGKDRPTGGFLERIPFGVWLAGCAALAFVTFLFIDEMDIGVNYLGETILIAFAAFAIALEGIAMLVSFVARVKAGDFRKHTLCGLAVRGFGTLSKNWSTVWRVAVPTALLLGANGILALIIGADRSELAFLLMVILDVAAFVFIVREAIRWGRLTDTAAAIADGDSAARVSVADMSAGMRRHGETINRLGDGVALAVERQMRSERMRTDLIANVSHDLKTPLTSIVNYVDLLKNRPVEDETAKEYIEVLDRQAARLKQLIEDLVEATKASSGCISAEIGTVGVGEILSQAVTEYESRLAKSGVEAVMSCPDSSLCAAADGSLLWRVFDNLLSNACKYAQEGTRLYIDARRSRNEAVISFRNTSREPLNITADELMERFVRGDKARTTEGSGLGLSIARSLTELMGGGFRLDIDGDLFKVIVTLPVAEKPAEEMPALPAAEETTESTVEIVEEA